MFPNFHPETNFSSILIHSTHSLNFYTNQKSLFAKNWKLFTYERGLFEPWIPNSFVRRGRKWWTTRSSTWRRSISGNPSRTSCPAGWRRSCRHKPPSRANLSKTFSTTLKRSWWKGQVRGQLRKVRGQMIINYFVWPFSPLDASPIRVLLSSRKHVAFHPWSDLVQCSRCERDDLGQYFRTR